MSDEETDELTFLDTAEEKQAFNIRSEERTRAYLRSRTWEEKVASIVRMREASKHAREGMRATLEQHRKAQAEGVS